jgi:hypothetical protein
VDDVAAAFGPFLFTALPMLAAVDFSTSIRNSALQMPDTFARTERRFVNIWTSEWGQNSLLLYAFALFRNAQV